MLAGYPKTGKTTLADELGRRYGWKVYHTDDVIDLGQGADSLAVTEWFNSPGDWVVEGVIAPRAIRKWLALNPKQRFPAEAVAFLKQHITHWENKGTFTKGLDTVWAEVRQHVDVVSPDWAFGLLEEVPA